MLPTSPTQQTPATTDLPEPAANESFCTWLYDRIKNVFQTILNWLCCCSPRADVPTPEPAPSTPPTPVTSAISTMSVPILPPAPPAPPPIPSASTTSSPAPPPPPATTTTPLPPPIPPRPRPITPTTSTSDWSEVEPYLQSPERLATLPRAQSRSPVYFTEHFVIKQCTRDPAQIRWNQTERAQALCTSQRYTRLIVPEARVFGDFVVERRLPLNMHGMKEQIGLYSTHRAQFTAVAEQFAAFLCKATLGDIIGSNNDPIGQMSPGPFARYDNATLYLERVEGRLGLVDLEDFSPVTRIDAFTACESAIVFFPLHMDEILATVRRAGGTITPNDESRLNTIREQALERFNTVYIQHAMFLRAKNITLDNPRARPVITAARKQAIIDTLTPTVSQHPRVNDLLPEIWDNAMDLLSTLLGEAPPPTPTLPPELRLIQLASSRSFLLYNDDESPLRIAAKKIIPKLNHLTLTTAQKRQLAIRLLEDIFTELARGGEIAYFKYESGHHILFC